MMVTKTVTTTGVRKFSVCQCPTCVATRERDSNLSLLKKQDLPIISLRDTLKNKEVSLYLSTLKVYDRGLENSLLKRKVVLLRVTIVILVVLALALVVAITTGGL